LILSEDYTLSPGDVYGPVQLVPKRHWAKRIFEAVLWSVVILHLYALMGGEDSRFCDHIGIDLDAIEDAISDNAEGGRIRGGSTITQQTAKNVFLWNGGGYPRKAVEAWAALYTNIVWGKRRTMEIYLNVAEWGDGIFGAEAAAQARFGKPASALTKREAALLAAVLPSPNKWRVDPPGPYVSGRAATLMQRAEVIRTREHDRCLRLEDR